MLLNEKATPGAFHHLSWKPGTCCHGARTLLRLADRESDCQISFFLNLWCSLMSLRSFKVLWRQPRALCAGKFCCTDYRSSWQSHNLSSPTLLLCWFIVTQIQFNCKGEMVLRMSVVSASQKKANSPAVPSAGTWMLACKLRRSSGTVCFPVIHCLVKVLLLLGFYTTTGLVLALYIP